MENKVGEALSWHTVPGLKSGGDKRCSCHRQGRGAGSQRSRSGTRQAIHMGARMAAMATKKKWAQEDGSLREDGKTLQHRSVWTVVPHRQESQCMASWADGFYGNSCSTILLDRLPSVPLQCSSKYWPPPKGVCRRSHSHGCQRRACVCAAIFAGRATKTFGRGAGQNAELSTVLMTKSDRHDRDRRPYGAAEGR